MAEIAQKEAITQQQLAEAEVTYQKTIAQADRSYQAQEYRQAITTYRQALALKSEEAYPRNMIGKAEQALAALEKQQADEAEKQRQEEEKINTLKLKYTGIIAEADQAFKNENYSAAKLRYSEADQLNLGEDYPRKRLGEIEQIIHSSKYKARLAEYNKNKTLAEKNLEQNQESEKQQGERQQEQSGGRRRNLNLSSLDGLSGLMTEEETLAAQMMRENGNSMDVTA